MDWNGLPLSGNNGRHGVDRQGSNSRVPLLKLQLSTLHYLFLRRWPPWHHHSQHTSLGSFHTPEGGFIVQAFDALRSHLPHHWRAHNRKDELQGGPVHPAHPSQALPQLFSFSHCAAAITKGYEGRMGYMLLSS